MCKLRVYKSDPQFDNMVNFISNQVLFAWRTIVNCQPYNGRNFISYLQSVRRGHGIPNDIVGYLIEKMTYDLIGYQWNGGSFQTEAPYPEGFRADIVITAPNGAIGYIDITSSDQEGHILKKGSGYQSWKWRFAYVAEAFYPSFTKKQCIAIIINYLNMIQSLSTQPPQLGYPQVFPPYMGHPLYPQGAPPFRGLQVPPPPPPMMLYQHQFARPQMMPPQPIPQPQPIPPAQPRFPLLSPQGAGWDSFPDFQKKFYH